LFCNRDLVFLLTMSYTSIRLDFHYSKHLVCLDLLAAAVGFHSIPHKSIFQFVTDYEKEFCSMLASCILHTLAFALRGDMAPKCVLFHFSFFACPVTKENRIVDVRTFSDLR